MEYCIKLIINFKSMNVTCPKCLMENAYYNGRCYECPDCDYQWDTIELEDDEDLVEID